MGRALQPFSGGGGMTACLADRQTFGTDKVSCGSQWCGCRRPLLPVAGVVGGMRYSRFSGGGEGTACLAGMQSVNVSDAGTRYSQWCRCTHSLQPVVQTQEHRTLQPVLSLGACVAAGLMEPAEYISCCCRPAPHQR